MKNKPSKIRNDDPAARLARLAKRLRNSSSDRNAKATDTHALQVAHEEAALRMHTASFKTRAEAICTSSELDAANGDAL